MISFPNIDPEIFSFSILGFELSLRWYSLSYIIGFLIAVMIMKILVNRSYLWRESCPPIDDTYVEPLIFHLVLGVIIGGRLGYVLFYNFQYYLSKPLDIIRVWDGGMSFHGGFLGVMIAAIFFSYKNKIEIWSTADLIAASTPPGLFLGRLSNFINNELWGRPTTVPWGVVFPGERAQNCPQFEGFCARHPSQLYEAVLEGPILFIAIFLIIRFNGLKLKGLITGVFFVGYGFARFFVEFYRVPDPQFISEVNPNGYAYWAGDIGFTMGQFLSLPMVLVGIFLIGMRAFNRG